MACGMWFVVGIGLRIEVRNSSQLSLAINPMFLRRGWQCSGVLSQNPECHSEHDQAGQHGTSQIVDSSMLIEPGHPVASSRARCRPRDFSPASWWHIQKLQVTQLSSSNFEDSVLTLELPANHLMLEQLWQVPLTETHKTLIELAAGGLV
eukprot:2187715-Amphidinium_carterae.3